MSIVLYKCDRNRCSDCNDCCDLTAHVKYAKNFTKIYSKALNDVCYVEKQEVESLVDYKFKKKQNLYFIVSNNIENFAIFSTSKWKHSIAYENDKITPKIILVITDTLFKKSEFTFNGNFNFVFDNERDAVKYLLNLPHKEIFISN